MEGGEVKFAAVVVRLVRRGGKDGMFLKGDTCNLLRFHISTLLC